MSLHTVNHTDPQLWRDCLLTLAAGDAVLLLEEAVYLALPGALPAPLPAETPCYVLQEDLVLRGLLGRTGDFQPISAAGFVALTLEHPRVVSWS